MADLTAAEYEAVRSSVELDYNTQRDQREQQFTSDKVELEQAFHEDLQYIEARKQAALVDAGLNPDGSDPQGRPRGGE